MNLNIIYTKHFINKIDKIILSIYKTYNTNKILTKK